MLEYHKHGDISNDDFFDIISAEGSVSYVESLKSVSLEIKTNLLSSLISMELSFIGNDSNSTKKKLRMLTEHFPLSLDRPFPTIQILNSWVHYSDQIKPSERHPETLLFEIEQALIGQRKRSSREFDVIDISHLIDYG